MPGFDRTGPEGKGSRSGRGLGRCNPNNQNSKEQSDSIEFSSGMRRKSGRRVGMRYGLGKGMGKGMGRRLGQGNS